MNKENYILWLPSWYPNEVEPYNGDFIQRHARAASLHNNITVVFFTQYGEAVTMERKVSKTVSRNLTEIVVYVPFKPWGFRFADKIRYNISFYLFSKKFLKAFIQEKGLPRLVHVHVPVKAGNLALWIKKKFGVLYIVSEHASTYSKKAVDSFFNRHWLYRSQVKKIFSNASAVTNVSIAIGRLLQELFALKTVGVIHNVVDTEIFKPIFLPKKGFNYVHVSSLTDQKNVYGILRAFKKLAAIKTDWLLTIVGPFSGEIKKFVHDQGLGLSVCFVGEVCYSAVADYMNAAHVLVLFSKHENFPCVIIEALCCGLPVVSSDVAGINEAVNVSNGILVEPENEDALLNALITVRENYDKYDGIAIATEASGKFNYLAISKKIDELYKLVEQKG